MDKYEKTKSATILLLFLAVILCLPMVSFARKGINLNTTPKVLYVTMVNDPAFEKSAKVDDLPLKSSVTQYGITWTFEKHTPVGQFVNGDYYVVGPTTIVAITPEPKNGRNGSCLNPSATIEKAGFDSRILYGRYDPKLFLAPPIMLKPGDSLLSSISLEEIHTVKPMLWRIGKDQRSPVRTVAVLACLDAPVPSDAFRPSYSGKEHRIYLARDLKRDLLPRLPKGGHFLQMSPRPE